MKPILKLVLFITLVFSWASTAFEYQEGNQYTVVAEKKTNKPELREYFSFYCPACRGFEAYLGDFEALLPTGTSLEKTHVDFMGHTSKEIQFMMGKALIVAQKAGIDKKFSQALFKYLQTDRAKIENEKDIRNVFVLSGGDGDMFDKSINNFSVVTQAKRNQKVQDALSAKRALKSVPTFVVNGKYLINSKALDKNNFMEDYKNLVKYLLTK